MNRKTLRVHTSVAGCWSVLFLLAALLLALVPQAFAQGNRPPDAGPPKPPPAGPISSGSMPGKPQVTPVLTDKEQLALGNLFGTVDAYGINQAGDFVFVSGAQTALFLRRAGDMTATRLLQTGDPVPGLPEGRCYVGFGCSINNTGTVGMVVPYYSAHGSLMQIAICTYNQAGFHLIAHSGGPAPGTGGASYGREMGAFVVNDAEDVAFSASLDLLVTGALRTLFMAPAGGFPMRIVGPGDPAPETGGGKFASVGAAGFNNRSEQLFTAAIQGGAGGHGLFVWSADGGIQKIVTHGDSMPGGGTFNFASGAPSARLNNLGEVAFGIGGPDGSIWVHKPDGSLACIVLGNSTPAPPDEPAGTLSTPSMAAFNDAGEIAFTALANRSSPTQPQQATVLLRYDPSNTENPIRTVAGQGDSIPEYSIKFGTNFRSIFLNKNGGLTFFHAIPGTSAWRGLFLHTRDNSLKVLLVEGAATTLAGGGVFDFTYLGIVRILDNGSVSFYADVRDGAAWSGIFSSSGPGVSRALISTEDVMPAGGRVSFWTFHVGAAGNFLAFQAKRAGGQDSLEYLSIGPSGEAVLCTFLEDAGEYNLGWWRFGTDNRLEKLFARGDLAPQSGGGTFTLVFQGSSSNGTGRFLWLASVFGGAFSDAIYITK